MSVTYLHLEDPGHKFHCQSMHSDHHSSKHGQEHINRQYRLPPPRSSIPIGLIMDDNLEGPQARSLDRTDMTPSRSGFVPQREQLPPLHQVLSPERSTGYLPPPPPPPHHRSGQYRSHDSQSSPILGSISPASYSNPFRESERVSSNYTLSRGKEYDSYHTSRSQSGRLPSMSEVGIGLSQTRVSEHSHSHSHSRSGHLQDEDSLRSQYVSTMNPPSQSVHTSSHLLPIPSHERLPIGSPHGPIVPNQVVEERHLPGKGDCYIFADNSYCPKFIDGQPVNPNWGLTKAGKARKRLAQACIACREKKVKCQPNQEKCDQCQKSGRECRFESTPRTSRGRSLSYDFSLE